ncbi:MAG: hypothetical protein CBD16_06870 [Betaproteobacteria bacterium TMED156]|nr:MAG: hypothetical protein CBD16_06870 [Betaproteobacteria bacterium TMED156]|tara:strand:+ start:490 stop:867 length:378 start_codon:yes stop_codon:yes gene_type:complete
MNITLWCLLFVGLLPIFCAGISKSKSDYDNKNPRAWLGKQDGFRLRAYNAQKNSWEAFIWFSIAILLTEIEGISNLFQVQILSLAYILLRLLYIAAYVLNFSLLRTLFWSTAFIINISIFIIAIV